MGVLPVYGQSFFCGTRRDDGLKWRMMYDDGYVYCDMFVDPRFEGYENVVHGAIVFAVLDVIIWYVIMMETGKICVTRHTEMDYLKPVMCNTHYRAKGQFLRIEDKDVFAAAWVEDENGEICTKIDAIFREAKDTTVADVINKFDFSETSPDVKEKLYSYIA